MHRPSGTLAVRLTLWTLVFAAVAMALVQPAQAGTEAAPEIQDPAGDRAAGGQVPLCTGTAAGCVTGSQVDVVTVWIDNDTAAAFDINIRVQGAIQGGVGLISPGPVLVTSNVYNAHFTVGTTQYTASATIQNSAATLGGVANAARINGTLLTLNVLKSAVGGPAPGSALTEFNVDTATSQSPAPAAFITDRAPNDGNGADYTFAGGSGGGGGTPGDADGDGMNDTCETKYFGNTTAQNASGDPDHDGLTNGQECALGTDPTKADTDGDGTNDKDDPYPTDPTRGGSNSTSSSSSSSSHSSSSSSSSSTSHSSSSSSATGGATNGKGTKGAPKDLNEALDRLTSDPGYLGLSSGGFLAVLVLCIIGLAVRWSL
jgi:hypothetical protein